MRDIERETQAGPCLRVPEPVWEALTAHLESAYPGEGCGVLVGRREDGARRVTEAVPSENEWSSRDDRYSVDPDLLRELMVREEEGGPAVLGFYHSHPDAEPVPSATDRRLGWPWYHYLIVRVSGGEVAGARLWQFGGTEEAPLEGSVDRDASEISQNQQGETDE